VDDGTQEADLISCVSAVDVLPWDSVSVPSSESARFIDAEEIRGVAKSTGTLVARWREGDQQAATELFSRYAGRLIALARKRLSHKFAGHIDPEDVVQSVYRSFFADTREGRYEIKRGGDLWQLLVSITLHKLTDKVRQNKAGRRAVQREQHFGSEDSLVAMRAHIGAHQPTPVEAAALAEQVEQLMAQLVPLHRKMLERRLQGYNLAEIAAEMQCSQRTVIRVLDRIKQKIEQGKTG
jgi:RNA polymerase sigma-70 factor (ECF subfamily)